MQPAMMPLSGGVLAVGLVLLGLGLFSAFCLARFFAGLLASAGGARRSLVLASCGLGLVALGCRLDLAQGNVPWAPYLDQWGAELSGIAAPLAHGTLGWRDLAAGNNEHRVLLTRALSLAVMLVNGCWDNRVMVIANYLMESLLVAWVGALSWRHLGWARGSLVAAAALLPMLLVCQWETIMWSNQTQFVFMAFGSVLALSLFQGHSLGSAEGWGPVAPALLALGSMASGFLTLVAIIAVGLGAAFVGRRGPRSVVALCAVCGALALLGWQSRAPFPALHFLYAKSVAQWAGAFLAYAAWPLPANLLGFLGLWFPWLALLVGTLARRRMHPLAPFALGLGLWVLLQACAIAWARAGLSSLVSSRYTEFVGWGFAANAAALAIGGAWPALSRRGRLASWAVLAAWLGVVGGREIWLSNAVYRPYFRTFRAYTVEHEQLLGTFLRKGDPAAIKAAAFPHSPHYDPEAILSLLGDPVVQPLLPGPMRRDLVRDREPSLLPEVHDGPLSRAAVLALRNGPWFAAAGVLLLLGACVGGVGRARRRDLPQAAGLHAEVDCG